MGQFQDNQSRKKSSPGLDKAETSFIPVSGVSREVGAGGQIGGPKKNSLEGLLSVRSPAQRGRSLNPATREREKNFYRAIPERGEDLMEVRKKEGNLMPSRGSSV